MISPILVVCVGNALRVPVMLPFALRDPTAFRVACRTQWRCALAVAVLGPLGYIMVLYAVRMAPLSHVAPAREVSLLFAALAGGTLLGEAVGTCAWLVQPASRRAWWRWRWGRSRGALELQRRRVAQAASPATPKPNKAHEVGSGTGAKVTTRLSMA